MSSALVLRVHLHQPRYHGVPDWPPSPARVFQAIVAGAGPVLAEPANRDALAWLEGLPPPEIAAPAATLGQEVVLFVPNNDLDAKGGDPARVPEIRVAKSVRPRLIEGDPCLVYVWRFDGEDVHACAVAALAERLYQLGRGVDPAWAEAFVVPDAEADAALAGCGGGPVLHPSPGGIGDALACPRDGTLASLVRRHAAQGERFGRDGKLQVFRQPPRPVFAEVAYGATARREVFALRATVDLDHPRSVRVTEAHDLVVAVRDAALQRLESALGTALPLQQVVRGVRPGEERHIGPRDRVRILPLPSVGHQHVDAAIRRVLVELPTSGPVSWRDLRWGFSGLEVGELTLVGAADDTMVRHYTRPSAVWSSVTPVALQAHRRRLEPGADEPKGAAERLVEERAAIGAVRDALRHAGVAARCLRVEVQREPWTPKGERAESFQALPRFPKEGLWHVRVTLGRPMGGPLVLGDGRYLGLGVMVPEATPPDVFAWDIVDGLEHEAQAVELASALRRAVMSRCQTVWGREPLPRFISGHERDGSRAESHHEHLHLVADLPRRRLLVVAPRGDRRLARALDGLREVRAGRAGRLTVARRSIDRDGDPLLGPATRWRTLTPYAVARHLDRGDARAAVAEDLLRAVREAGLPDPATVEVTQVLRRSGAPLAAHVALAFHVAVPGPLALGRTRHKGGGVFEHAP